MVTMIDPPRPLPASPHPRPSPRPPSGAPPSGAPLRGGPLGGPPSGGPLRGPPGGPLGAPGEPPIVRNLGEYCDLGVGKFWGLQKCPPPSRCKPGPPLGITGIIPAASSARAPSCPPLAGKSRAAHPARRGGAAPRSARALARHCRRHALGRGASRRWR